MAREVDYVSPMLYPSHWGAGEYGLATRTAEPYEIVRRSLEDFKIATYGTGARLVPWLQDFSLGADYGPAEVKAQIAAARDAGGRDFLLWDPAVTYTSKALDPNARFPTSARSRRARAPLRRRSAPNELGVVPVLMYHQLLPDGGGDYDLTPAEFRRELERLWREGYRPIRASDLVNGTIDVPRGNDPGGVDVRRRVSEPGGAHGVRPDRSEHHGGSPRSSSRRRHPGFEPAGTFYVNREPFAAGERTADLSPSSSRSGSSSEPYARPPGARPR